MNILLIVLVIMVVVLAGALAYVLSRSARPTPGATASRPTPGEYLVAAMEDVDPGLTEDQVRATVGFPHAVQDRSWIYYLDRNSGYEIVFDGNGHVERAQSWVR